MQHKIMILDDEPGIRLFLSLSLQDSYIVLDAGTPEQAYKLLESNEISLVLLDLSLGRHSGLDVLRVIKEKYSETAVIMMTAFGNISSSVEAIKLGAYNYLTKPLNLDELKLFISQALEFQNLNRKVEYLSGELETRNSYGNMVGRSQEMQKVYKLIDKLKDLDTSVIITGESGTGKELAARALHYAGIRKQQPFISMNCAAIPAGLLEEEFFGHKRGAFTGAVSDNAGKLNLADGGTFFLDEIGEMPLELQSKLLRVIQEKETRPIGGDKYKKIDVRFVSATNCDLWAMVQKGQFRQDLYYRLHVVDLAMPALRDRKQDIPLLCEQFIHRLSKNVKGMTRRAETLLVNYNYPGNVRELINAIEYAMVLCEGAEIDAEHLPEKIRTGICPHTSVEMDAEQAIRTYLNGKSFREIERLMIKVALDENPKAKSSVAKLLGISERSLFYKIQEYGL